MGARLEWSRQFKLCTPETKPPLLIAGRVCRFGNPVAKGVSGAAIAASGRGPGPVTTSISVSTDGEVQVAFMARTAGSYSLTVTSLASGDPLAGMPLRVRYLACRV